jgi:hypothetical protein
LAGHDFFGYFFVNKKRKKNKIKSKKHCIGMDLKTNRNTKNGINLSPTVENNKRF